MKKTFPMMAILATMTLVSCEGLGPGGETYDLLPWAVVAPYMPYTVGDTCEFVSTDPIDSNCVFTVSTVHRDPDSKEYNLNRYDTSPSNEHYAIMTSGRTKIEMKMKGDGDMATRSFRRARVYVEFPSGDVSWGTSSMQWPDSIVLTSRLAYPGRKDSALLVRNKGLVWFKDMQGVSWTLKED